MISFIYFAAVSMLDRSCHILIALVKNWVQVQTMAFPPGRCCLCGDPIHPFDEFFVCPPVSPSLLPVLNTDGRVDIHIGHTVDCFLPRAAQCSQCPVCNRNWASSGVSLLNPFKVFRMTNADQFIYWPNDVPDPGHLSPTHEPRGAGYRVSLACPPFPALREPL